MVSEYYERRLPHWQPHGTALFVTWRLHGSLPKRRPMITSAGKVFAAMDQQLAKAAAGPRWLEEQRVAQGFSARHANELLGRSGLPFWQDESYDHWVRDQEELNKVVRYIEFNPVAAGLVAKPEDWRWSSGWAGREACPTLEV